MNIRLKTSVALLAVLLLCAACGESRAETTTGVAEPQAMPDLDTGHVLSADQVHNAGIKTSAAVSKTLTATLKLPAMAEEDLDEQAHVNSILPGVITKVAAKLGHEVEKGTLLCTIRSAALAEAVADLRSARTVLETSVRMQKREQEILRRGVALAMATKERETQMVEDGFGTARDQAAAKHALQTAELARDRRSLELDQLITRQRNALSAAAAKLEAWGFDAGYVDSPDSSIGTYSLYADQAGVVMERHITEGESVDAQTQLFLIQGMGKVWMLASVFENQIRLVNEGVAATVRFNAYPDLAIEGVVDQIDHHLDLDTRSVKARVQVINSPLPGRKDPHPLLPGMYGSMEVATGTVNADVVVPTSSVLKEGERSYLFTVDEHSSFRRRFVETGLRTADEVEVRSGITVGEQVVVEGIFILESMLRAESLAGEE